MKLEEMVGKRMTEAQFDEAAGEKDACYRKVKARYDVWPSAYASGALVKCRKVGAANWGNKSKKESVEENILKQIQQAEKIAKSMAGNMTGAVKGIEKIRRGLSRHKRVKVALKKYNESVNEGKLSEDYKNSEWEVYVADENGKEKIMKKAKSKRAGVILYNKLINSDNYYEVGMRVVKESVDEGMTKQQADVTLKQLGANKFIAMTGAKQFSFGKQGLGFRIGKNSKSINYVRVDLKSNDLYDMEFIRIRGSKIKVVKKVTGVYNDQLQKIFTKHTGLYTRL